MSQSKGAHIMVDLETMGSRPGSVIASIGAVVFDPVAGTVGETFYRTIALASAAEAGLQFDADTVKWWLKQGDQARAALWQAEGSLQGVLLSFTAFCMNNSVSFFWSHGANFDDPLLAEAYRAADLKRPWAYWDSRCTRTIFDLAGVKPDRAAGVHHTALDDAKAQAAAVILAYRRLGLAEGMADRFIVSLGLHDIVVERRRQITDEGWSAEHDDVHVDGSMALAAAAYATAAITRFPRPLVAKIASVLWPWAEAWWKPRDARRNLVRSGALCAAEIDRIDRAKARELTAFEEEASRQRAAYDLGTSRSQGPRL